VYCSFVPYCSVHPTIAFYSYCHCVNIRFIQYNTFNNSPGHRSISPQAVVSLYQFCALPNVIHALAPSDWHSFHFCVAVSTCVHAKVICDSKLNSVGKLWTAGQDSCSPAKRFLCSLLGPCNATTLPATSYFELVVIIDGHCHPVVGAALWREGSRCWLLVHTSLWYELLVLLSACLVLKHTVTEPPHSLSESNFKILV
jgi:hypothetical protein